MKYQTDLFSLHQTDKLLKNGNRWYKNITPIKVL